MVLLNCPDWLRGPRLKVFCIVLVVAVGLADYLSGHEISFSIFYVAPVAMAAWCSGKRWGVTVSFVATVLWFCADISTHPPYSHGLIPYWNLLVRLGFFLLISLTVAELQRARAMQEELTQFIIHDLRAPVAGIGMSLNILRRSSDRLDDKEKRLVDAAYASVQWMETLINSTLGLSRLQNAKMPVNPAEVDVAELLNQAAQGVGPLSEGSGAPIVTEAPGSLQKAHADRELTLRVLVNLIANAIKFSPKGSAVVLGAYAHAGGQIALTVRDHGEGIPEEWLPRVFDPYSQVAARKSGTMVGSGLGLAFCKEAVEAQGGRIWMESSPGNGTTVTFLLPAVATDEQPVQKI